MRRRVAITGMGWVTPLGHEIETVWQAILTGVSGLAPTTNFDARTFPTTFASEVKDFDLAAHLGEHYEAHKACSRQVGFALAAGLQAWRQAGMDRQPPEDMTRVGVYMGGGEGPLDFDSFSAAAIAGWDYQAGNLDMRAWAKAAYARLTKTIELEQEPNMAVGHLATLFGAEGPAYDCLTACAASTQAIGEASLMIRRGDTDVMISGGSHSMVHPLGVTGFSRLTALSTRNDEYETASRPFDGTRDGFVIGEGAAVLILEEWEHAVARGATILAEVVGFGSTADAFRITDIHDEARGAIAAMRQAIADAGLTPEQIDYINAHGTSTGENDKCESMAVRGTFGEPSKCPPVSSVKAVLGHLIGAAGAAELITCVLALRDQIIPPTWHYKHADPLCDLDYVPNAPRKAALEHVLSNSFGFGGQNDTLVLWRVSGD